MCAKPLQFISRGTIAAVAAACLTGQAATGGSVVLTPANNIQAAINSGSYTEIILSEGVYNQSFVIDAADAPLTIRSIDPADQSVVDNTVLDGVFLGTSVILLTAGVGNDVVVDGLTIMNGEAFGAVGPDNRGGAIDCEQASPIVRRCVMMDNEASSAGGAFYVNDGSPLLEDCTFMGNLAVLGGAVYCNNANVTMTGCRFELNSATDEGGACRLFNGSYTMERCTFDTNDSVALGGAVSVRGNALLETSRCWFEMNFSGDGGSLGRGGAIYANSTGLVNVSDSVFNGNSVSQFGGALYAASATDALNCTFYNNTAPTSQGVVAANGATLLNCIAWVNASGQLDPDTVVRYSIIEGGYPGEGNLGADSGHEPQFADAANGDFHLLPGSAGIDAGDTGAVPGEYPVDYDGLSRAIDDPDTVDTGIAVVGISVDMGAYELQAEPAPACPGDVNGSGVIDIEDLLMLLAGWGACP